MPADKWFVLTDLFIESDIQRPNFVERADGKDTEVLPGFWLKRNDGEGYYASTHPLGNPATGLAFRPSRSSCRTWVLLRISRCATTCAAISAMRAEVDAPVDALVGLLAHAEPEVRDKGMNRPEIHGDRRCAQRHLCSMRG